MGISKSDQFTESQNRIALLAKALGHPARVAILEHIVSSDACICGDLVKELPLAQPTISQHLKELKSAGLIKGTVEGTSLCYCLADEAVAELKGFLNSLVLYASKSNQNCC